MKNFDAFIFYQCPECDHKSQDCATFSKHAALKHHEKASKFLNRMVEEGNVELDLTAVKLPLEVRFIY